MKPINGVWRGDSAAYPAECLTEKPRIENRKVP